MRFRIYLSASMLAVSALITSAAEAQVIVTPPSVSVQIPGPPILRFEREPELYEVEPGVQVVPGYEQEVFYVDGFYWHNNGGRWYRTSDWRGGWIVAPPPRRLNRFPHGRYRNWHPEPEYRGEPGDRPGHRYGNRHGGRYEGERPGGRVVVTPPQPSRVVVTPQPSRVVVTPPPGPPGQRRRRHGE